MRQLSLLYGRIHNKDENEVRNILYSELKSTKLLEDDCLELLRKRASVYFTKLFRDKIAHLDKGSKKRSVLDQEIHDMLFKSNFDG